MSTMALLVALSALGVESGYEPSADGQLEYIVQIDPQLVPQLAKGQDVTSELPRGLVIRHFRVTVGVGKLPRQAIDNRVTRNRPPGAGQGAAPPADEPGLDTQDVRVGYQPLAQGDGEFVIEITPTGLGDLDHHDLTGDVPANLAISRVRISTQPGSAPVIPVSATVPASGVPTPAIPAVGSSVPDPPAVPPLVPGAGQPTPATPPGGAGSPTAADSGPPLEPLSPLEESELAHPEDGDPRFQYPDDPVAAPIRSQLPGRSAAGDSAPALGSPSPAEPRRDASSDRQGAAGSRRAPAPLAADPHSAPLTGSNVTYRDEVADEAPSTEHRAQKPSQGEKPLSGLMNKAEKDLENLEDEVADKTKSWHWFPLAVTLALFLSIGANLYMGWVAWDARNRSRELLARFRAGELKPS